MIQLFPAFFVSSESFYSILSMFRFVTLLAKSPVRSNGKQSVCMYCMLPLFWIASVCRSCPSTYNRVSLDVHSMLSDTLPEPGS